METQTYSARIEGPQWVSAAANAARFAARKRRLQGADAEDLRSEVWLKVLRNDQAVLRQFSGRSSLESFLITVADRCALDQQVRKLGKWRPTVAAKTTGAGAVLVERLTVRDGLPLDQALEIIRAKGQPVESAVRHIEAAKPMARTRLRFTTLDAETREPADHTTPEALCSAADNTRRGGPIKKALGRCLGELTPDELRLVTRRFLNNEKVADIARTEGRDQKTLYRTLERVCIRLRTSLNAAGISAQDACSILGAAEEPLAGVLSAVVGSTGAAGAPR